jgi:hypothetical protein
MGNKGVRETGRPFSFQSGCDADVTAALNLGVTKVLAPNLARRYRNQSEFSGACGDDQPLAASRAAAPSNSLGATMDDEHLTSPGSTLGAIAYMTIKMGVQREPQR